MWDSGSPPARALVDTISIPPLLNILGDPKRLITHCFKFDGILDTYETFAQAADTRALKVILEA